MEVTFYLAAGVAALATLMVVTRTNAIHALLYLVVSLLAVALIFYILGAPFAAALEVIVYAGAIVILFVFAVMTLNVAEGAMAQERAWLAGRHWIVPAVLAGVLLAELVYLIWRGGPSSAAGNVVVDPHVVGVVLVGPYLLAVELASMLLLAGLIGAYHLGRTEGKAERERHEKAAR